MNWLYVALSVFFIAVVLKLMLARPGLSPAEAARRVAAGTAVLVDVRERAETAGGAAAPALLLPLSDLQGPRHHWGRALDEHRDKEWILYCASGLRSALAASILRREGRAAVNLGGFGAWVGAGLPVRR